MIRWITPSRRLFFRRKGGNGPRGIDVEQCFGEVESERVWTMERERGERRWLVLNGYVRSL